MIGFELMAIAIGLFFFIGIVAGIALITLLPMSGRPPRRPGD
jgi:hypothetical protein